MQLVINTRGAFLKKEKNCFLVKNEEKIVEVSADKIDSILITTSATITTDAIEFAVENNIDIIFLDYHGNPFGRVWHSKLGSTTLIRRRRLEAESADTGFYLARGWIATKIQNQIDLLKDLKKNRPDQKDQLDISIAKIEGLRETLLAMKGSLDIKRGSIMGVEGMASSAYLDAIAAVMPEQWRFKGRAGTGKGRLQLPAQLRVRRALLAGRTRVHHRGTRSVRGVPAHRQLQQTFVRVRSHRAIPGAR